MDHNVIPAGELHHPFNWIFADAAARAALVSAGVNDIHKLAYQQDDGSVWVLADDSPLTWVLFQAPATTSQSGLMSSADKTKLIGIESGAEVNTVDSVAGKTGAVTLDKGDVGLGNVDNTSDANKPVSTAQAAADALKYDKTGGAISGDVELTGTARRIKGDCTNATVASRLAVQTNVANGSTTLSIIPNGISNIAGLLAHNASDPNNASYVGLYLTSATASLDAGKFGTGSYIPWSFSAGGAERLSISTSGHVAPGADNTQNFGSGSLRWATIYAGTGTINTSDAREKTPVLSLTSDEINAAKALAKEIGSYQFLASMAQKGDDARHHIGMTVQRAVEIMELHGLNPMRYGFICYDEWEATEARDAEMDEDGNVITAAVPARPAGDRYSFRPDELLLFLSRGFEARLAALEAQLS
jgi:hypothetical protein